MPQTIAADVIDTEVRATSIAAILKPVEVVAIVPYRLVAVFLPDIDKFAIIDITDPPHPKLGADPSGIEHLLSRTIGKKLSATLSAPDEIIVEPLWISAPSGFVVEKIRDAYYLFLSFANKSGIDVLRLDAPADDVLTDKE